MSRRLRRCARALAALLVAGGVVSAAPLPARQEALDRFAHDLQMRFTVLDNRPAGCTAEAGCFDAELSLAAPQDAGRDWTLYFNMDAEITALDTDQFAIHHINGDLWSLSPTPAFKGFIAGGLRIGMTGKGALLSRYYFYPNAYIAAAGLQPRIVDSTRPVTDPDTGQSEMAFVAPFEDAARLAGRSAGDHSVWPSAASRFDANGGMKAALAMPGVPQVEVIPTPASVALDPARRRLAVTRGVRVRASRVPQDRISVALDNLSSAGAPLSARGVPLDLNLRPMGGVPAGGYRLTIASSAIAIDAPGAEGIANGLYTLAALIGRDGSLPLGTVEDAPRFGFRGVHIDVARNFHGVQEILKLLNAMAAYKLNKLHLHLSDDQGWRLQIPALPELTAIGGQRCHDPQQTHCLMPQLGSGPNADGPGAGYFSSADYIAIVRAAKARNIEVIPSFDMPGHSMAAITAMEARAARLTAMGKPEEAARYRLIDPADTSAYTSVQGFSGNTINVCIESSYRFAETVLAELIRLHTIAGAPLKRYNIGGDETPGAWVNSPACKTMSARTGTPVSGLGARFLERLTRSVAAHGILPGAWSDGLAQADPHNLPPDMQSDSWETLFGSGVKVPHHQANAGMQVVVATPDATYFDNPNSPEPDERGNGWATRTLSLRKAFDFMPENLPANAEQWTDLNNNSGAIDDPEPLKPGVRFAGMQAQIWTERIATDDQIEYMYFPRLIAFAERAWHRAAWEVPYDPAIKRYDATTGYFTATRRAEQEADWRRFVSILGERDLRRLDAAGVRYRISVPGARIMESRLYANTSIPGLPIEYRQSGGGWRRYVPGVEVHGIVEVRARSMDGRRAGRAIRTE